MHRMTSQGTVCRDSWKNRTSFLTYCTHVLLVKGCVHTIFLQVDLGTYRKWDVSSQWWEKHCILEKRTSVSIEDVAWLMSPEASHPSRSTRVMLPFYSKATWRAGHHSLECLPGMINFKWIMPLDTLSISTGDRGWRGMCGLQERQSHASRGWRGVLPKPRSHLKQVWGIRKKKKWETVPRVKE